MALPSIDEAHATLLGNDQLQFDWAVAPATPHRPAEWEWYGWVGPGGVTLVWVIAGLLVLMILVLVVRHLNKSGRRPVVAPLHQDSAAAATIPMAAARSALGDADRLAAEGRFADAAHVLLACGVDAIAKHHPDLVRPATTSRDIAAMGGLPDTMRKAFARIARSVEIGLFGGRRLAADDYADCRQAFVTSALAQLS